MILVDTCVWIEHLHKGNKLLVSLLEDLQVVVHPFITGELACGDIEDRASVISDIRQLPQLPVASDDEVLMFIEKQKLMATGVGYIDAHLLASAKLSGTTHVWTLDKKLAAVAKQLEVG